MTGNERYMGYAVDLIKELANLMNFEYVFVPVADNGYGKYNKETKQWDGIIGELVNNVCIVPAFQFSHFLSLSLLLCSGCSHGHM